MKIIYDKNFITFSSYEEVLAYSKGKYTMKSNVPEVDIPEIPGAEYWVVNFNTFMPISLHTGYSICTIDMPRQYREDKLQICLLMALNKSKENHNYACNVCYDDRHITYISPDQNIRSIENLFIVFNQEKNYTWIKDYRELTHKLFDS